MAKSKRKRMTDRLDELCRKIVRIRDGNRCQRCNKFIQGSDSHPCHVVPKGNGASKRRFDLLNIFLACRHCHLGWWHLNPTESGKWFAEKFPAREGYLEIYRGGKPAKISNAEMETCIEFYKQKLSELEKENENGMPTL